MQQRVISDARKTAQESVDNMQITKYGFDRSLIGSTTFLSWLGIISSVVGIFGGVSTVVIGTCELKDLRQSVAVGRLLLDDYAHVSMWSFFAITSGSVIILSNLIFVLMWIHLKRRTTEKDISRIEQTVKTLCLSLSILEVIAVAFLVTFIISLSKDQTKDGENQLTKIVVDLAGTSEVTAAKIVLLVIGFSAALLCLIFAIVKIYGIQKEKDKMLQIYIQKRQVMFLFVGLGTIAGMIWVSTAFFSVLLLAVILFFILDIGLTVILQSIWRVDTVDMIENQQTTL